MSSLTTIDWLPSLIAFMTPGSLLDEQESPPVRASFNEASRTLILASEKIISPDEVKMLSSQDPVIRPRFLMTDAKPTLHLLSLEGVHGISIAYSRTEAPDPVVVALGEAPDALSNLDLKPIASGCRLVLQLNHIKVNQKELENLVRKVAKTFSIKGSQASQLPLAAALGNNEESKSQAELSTTSGRSDRSRLSSYVGDLHFDKKNGENNKGNLSQRETMTSTASHQQSSSSCSHEGAIQAERFSPMTLLRDQNRFPSSPVQAAVDMTFGQEQSGELQNILQPPSRDQLNADRPLKLDPLVGQRPKRQGGVPEEIYPFCFTYLSDLQVTSTKNSLRAIENNTVRYDPAIVDYLFDYTSYFSSGDPDFNAQVMGLRTKAKKNAASEVVQRIQKTTPGKLGLGYALFREAVSKMTDQTASDQVRMDVEPLFAAKPEKDSPEETYHRLLELRASGQANEADHLENDLTDRFPECIKFLQAKTLYFVKQELFQTTMNAIKQDLKSDCFQDVKQCLEPLLPARIGLAWALHIATVRCNHPECSLSEAFHVGDESRMEILDFITQLQGIDSAYPNANIDTIIDMVENQDDEPLEAESLLYEIGEIKNEEAKEEAKDILLRFAQDYANTELEESLVASTRKFESQVTFFGNGFFGTPFEETQDPQNIDQYGKIDVSSPSEFEENMDTQRKSTLRKRPKGRGRKDPPEPKPQPINQEKPSEEAQSLESHYYQYLVRLIIDRYQGKEDQAIAFENELAREDQPALRYLVFETPYFRQMKTFQDRLTELKNQGRQIKQILKSLIPDQVGLAWALHSSLLKNTKDELIRKYLTAMGRTLFPTPNEPAALTPIEALRSLLENQLEDKNLLALVSKMERNPNDERSCFEQILSLVKDPQVKEKAITLFNTQYNSAQQPPISSSENSPVLKIPSRSSLPKRIGFLLTQTLYFVKQKLFRVMIKKNQKSDCFQDLLLCLEPLLPAQTGLVALQMAPFQFDQAESRVRQLFSVERPKNKHPQADTFPDVDVHTVIRMIKANVLSQISGSFLQREIAFNPRVFGYGLPEDLKKAFRFYAEAISRKKLKFPRKKALLAKVSSVCSEDTSYFTLNYLDNWYQFAKQFWILTEDLQDQLMPPFVFYKQAASEEFEKIWQLQLARRKLFKLAQVSPSTRYEHFKNLHQILNSYWNLSSADLNDLVEQMVDRTFAQIKSVIVKEYDQFCLEYEIPMDEREQERIRLIQSCEKSKQEEISSLKYEFMVLGTDQSLKREKLQEQDLQAVKEVLPLLERKKFTIIDFATEPLGLQTVQAMSRLSQGWKKDNLIDGEDLIQIMFFFVKRRLHFTAILLQLKGGISEQKLTTIAMFDYLMRHSDQDLRALLVVFCSSYMAIPSLFKSPWSSEEVIIEEHFYDFKRFRTLLSIEVLNKNLPKESSEFLKQLLHDNNSFEYDKLVHVHRLSLRDRFLLYDKRHYYELLKNQVSYVSLLTEVVNQKGWNDLKILPKPSRRTKTDLDKTQEKTFLRNNKKLKKTIRFRN